VTVVDFAEPFFGFAVTVILHVPADTYLTVAPTALQYFFEEAATLIEICAPAGMTNFL
jgi:hypothetical protein